MAFFSFKSKVNLLAPLFVVAATLGMPAPASAQGDLAPISVSFKERQIETVQGSTIEVALVLSGRTWFETAVPYRIHPDSTAIEGEDFEIVPAAGSDQPENPILFNDRRTERTFQVRILNNAAAIGAGGRQLILELVEEGMTTVVPGSGNRYTIDIVDLEAPRVLFEEFAAEVREGEVIELPLTVSRSVPTAISVQFEAVEVTASEEDINLSTGGATPSPVTISGLGQTGTIMVGANHDGQVNSSPTRTFRIQLTSATALESGVELPIAVDDRFFEVTVVDIDPVELNFLDIDGAFEVDFKERTTVNLGVSLGVAARREITIPVSFTGIPEEDIQRIVDDELTIPEGADSVFFPVTPLRRNDPPEDYPKTLTITLGQAEDSEGNPIPMGSQTVFQINVLKLEDIKLSFGQQVGGGSGEGDPPQFEAEASRVVGRADRFFSLPIFIPDPAGDITFSLEIVPQGTTAQLLDPFSFQDPEQVEWDLQMRIGNQAFSPRIRRVDNITIPAGEQFRIIDMEFKQRNAETIAFDNATAPVASGDVTLRLRITAFNSPDQLVSVGVSEFDLTIRDFPNLDISPYFESLAPTGPARFNEVSGLFEVPFQLQLSEPLNAELLRGYRSMRFEFSSGVFDVNNPDPTLLERFPADTTPIQPFDLQVIAPFELAWPTRRERRPLIEGDPGWRVGTLYEERFADTVLPVGVVLRNLSLPQLNGDSSATSIGGELNEDLDLVFEFTHGGSRTFDLSRINPEINPEGFRVTLSRQQDISRAFNGGFVRPVRMVPDEEGNLVFQLRSQSGRRFRIQYWDGEGDWKTAAPAEIQTEGTTLFWSDTGLPKTDSPSKDVPFRLYRFFEIEQ